METATAGKIAATGKNLLLLDDDDRAHSFDMGVFTALTRGRDPVATDADVAARRARDIEIDLRPDGRPPR